jgi:hypothetical protein
MPQPAQLQTQGIRSPLPPTINPQNAYKPHALPGGADDVHMMTVNPSNISPTLLQQLALNDAATETGSTNQNVPVPPIAEQRVQVQQHQYNQDEGRDRDIRMQTANRGYLPPTSHAQGQRQQPYQPHHQVPVHTQALQQPQQQQASGPPALTAWEKQILNDPDVKRKATLAQLCEFVEIADDGLC